MSPPRLQSAQFHHLNTTNWGIKCMIFQYILIRPQIGKLQAFPFNKKKKEKEKVEVLIKNRYQISSYLSCGAKGSSLGTNSRIKAFTKIFQRVDKFFIPKIKNFSTYFQISCPIQKSINLQKYIFGIMFLNLTIFFSLVPELFYPC